MPRKISVIATDIVRDWKNVSPHAWPYLEAMLSIDNITDKYGLEDALMVVLYFLSNATHWRGETARAIKKELKALVDSVKR